MCRRDKGRCGGREGALCLSWVGGSEPSRSPLVSFVVGTRGCAAEGRGPCACPPWKAIPPPRTSTRPPHPPHTAPCPYKGLGVGLSPLLVHVYNIVRMNALI